MTSALEKKDDGTLVLTMTIPWTSVEQTYTSVVEKQKKETELPGFRKGKAPTKLVEEKLDTNKTYEEVVQELIPKAYADAVKEQNIHPIIVPKVELVQAKEKNDWIIRAYTCERPVVTLGDYKGAIREVKSTKQKKIWVPGQEQKKEEKEEDKQPTIEELLRALSGVVTIRIPSLLIEHEVNRLLSDLIDQTKKLGLTVEQYLASTSRTSESIRKEYEAQANQTMLLEFSLEDIADKEGVLVSYDDIDTVIKTAKTEDEKRSLEKSRYYVASVLRRQKTLDFLASL